MTWFAYKDITLLVLNGAKTNSFFGQTFRIAQWLGDPFTKKRYSFLNHQHTPIKTCKCAIQRFKESVGTSRRVSDRWNGIPCTSER